MANVSTGSALGYAFDPVVFELCFERLVNIDLGALTKLFIGFLVQRTLQIAHFRRKLLIVLEGSCLLSIHRIFPGLFHNLSLFVQTFFLSPPMLPCTLHHPPPSPPPLI